jgi:hypothetical protein
MRFSAGECASLIAMQGNAGWSVFKKALMDELLSEARAQADCTSMVAGLASAPNARMSFERAGGRMDMLTRIHDLIELIEAGKITPSEDEPKEDEDALDLR